MAYPQIKIDLNKIKHNARALVSVCTELNIEIVGVTKACLGNIEVAGAMMKAGVALIGDSRLPNLEKLSTLDIPLMMLRQPTFREIPRVVDITDICLVSELETIKRISDAAEKARKQYKVIVMVETGDLREGVLVGNLFDFMKEAMNLPWTKLEGIGSNVACLQGVAPIPKMLDMLVDNAKLLREFLGIELPIISGGNSSAWKLIESKDIPSGINQLRFGEAILLGQETINLNPIPGTYQDAFILEAEIIEIREKPVPEYSGDLRKRVILAIGTQDLCRGELKPLDAHVQILRRSSDHLVADITGSRQNYRVGDCLSFIPSYEAMLAAMTSPFVEKIFIS